MPTPGEVLFEPTWQRLAWTGLPAAGASVVWRIDLDAVEGAQSAQRGAGPLDAHELGRAARFVFDVDRRRFVAARVALRRILGACVGVDPAAVVIEAPPHGRPRLGGQAPPLDFNLSHSGRTALVVVSRCGPLGIDVEELRALPDADALADRLFTTEERSEWCAGGAAGRDLRFLACWTRKEAVLKSTGMGLAIEPRSVAVGTGPAPRGLLLDAPGGPVTLRVESFAVRADAIGACALPAGSRVAHWIDGPQG